MLRGPAAQANPSSRGSRRGWLEINPQIWGTPRASERGDCPSERERHNPDLRAQVVLAQAWATPIVGDSHLASTPDVAAKRLSEGKVTLSRQNAGKLNPRWVETLMGLPVGWTMPSCASPVTIAPTNCGSLATESSPQPQNELFAP